METSYNKTSWDTMTQTEDVTKTEDQVQQDGNGSWEGWTTYSCAHTFQQYGFLV